MEKDAFCVFDLSGGKIGESTLNLMRIMMIKKFGGKLVRTIKKNDEADWKIIFIVLAVKLVIFVFGFFNFLLFTGRHFTDSYWIFGIWNRWDANAYLRIALFGYTNEGERRFDIAFFPLYPALVRVLDTVFDNELLVGFIISGAASIAAGLLLYKLARLDYSESVAFSAVWFLLIFPTSYFLHIPYTESLFLALVIGSFLFARKKDWLVAGVLGSLACATRVNGLVLCFALLFEVWLQWREDGRKFDWRWLWLGLIPLGFVSYLILNYLVTGNAFTFLIYQREHWAKYFTFPWTSIWKQIRFAYFQTDIGVQVMAFQELIFAALGLSAIIFGWRYLRNSYRAWMILNWLLFVSTSYIQSVPRYTLTMFPLFILFGLAAEGRDLVYKFLSLWSILFLAVFVSAFVQGHWAF